MKLSKNILFGLALFTAGVGLFSLLGVVWLMTGGALMFGATNLPYGITTCIVTLSLAVSPHYFFIPE